MARPPEDREALSAAIVSLPTLSGPGSLVESRVPRGWLLGLSAIGLGTPVAMSGQLQVVGVLLVASPIALTTGTSFPAVFERAAANPLPVFALDAIGAGPGAILASFVPIIWGFGAFFALTLAVFALTATVDAPFHRERPSRPPWTA